MASTCDFHEKSEFSVPDHFQNMISSSVVESAVILQILQKSTDNFLSYSGHK